MPAKAGYKCDLRYICATQKKRAGTGSCASPQKLDPDSVPPQVNGEVLVEFGQCGVWRGCREREQEVFGGMGKVVGH